MWRGLNTDVDMETRWTVLRDLRINEYVMSLECSDPNQKEKVLARQTVVISFFSFTTTAGQLFIYSHIL